MTPPDDAALVAQGRTYVRIAAAAFVVVSAVSIVIHLVRLGPGKLPQQLVRLALTVGLASLRSSLEPHAAALTSAI